MRARVRVRTHSLPALPWLHQRLSLVSARKWGPRWQMRLVGGGGKKRPLRNTVQVSVVVLTGAQAPDMGEEQPNAPATLTFISLHSRESENAGNSSSYF